MNRRQFTQQTLAALVAGSQAVGQTDKATVGAKEASSVRGDWRTVPAATPIFEWHKVIARPSSSPGLANWCFLSQNPTSGEVVLSYDEITDPSGAFRKDPPRYDFSGLRRTQMFLISRDRGESWEPLAQHSAENSPGAWQLNGRWEKMSFLRNGELLAFGSEHTDGGRRPMLAYRLSPDNARSWTEWQPVLTDPKVGIFSGDFCQMRDGRWIHFHDVYDVSGPMSRSRIRRNPDVYMHRPASARRFGCAISEDGGVTWKSRSDLDITLEDELNGNEPYEPAVVSLSNGNLLVIVRRHRHAAFGGKGLPWRQWLLEPTASGFRILENSECKADKPLLHTGHPELICTHDGIVLAIRSDGMWASQNDGAFWENVLSTDLGYYPQGIELDDKSILVVGHHGADDPWPPYVDQDVRLTKIRLDRSPVHRNFDFDAHDAYRLDDTVAEDVIVEARVGTDGTAGLLARASVEQGALSGYIFIVSSKEPGWILGRLTKGTLSVISYGKLNGADLITPRPRLKLGTFGNAVRAFVDTYPVASGKDSTFQRGRAGVIAQQGRCRIDEYLVRPIESLSAIGGEQVELVRDMGVVSHEQASDNWAIF